MVRLEYHFAHCTEFRVFGDVPDKQYQHVGATPVVSFQLFITANVQHIYFLYLNLCNPPCSLSLHKQHISIRSCFSGQYPFRRCSRGCTQTYRYAYKHIILLSCLHIIKHTYYPTYLSPRVHTFVLTQTFTEHTSLQSMCTRAHT